MGTNYYKVKPVSRELKKELIAKINKNQFTVISNNTIEFDENIEQLIPNKVHIGKLSYGWKFLIDANEYRYFEKSEEAITNWIKDASDNQYIEDEYGKIIPVEEMLNIINSSLTKDRWDHNDYIRENPEIPCFDIVDYYVGKYRVSNYTDFS